MNTTCIYIIEMLKSIILILYETTFSTDLGGSSNYSNENFED